MKQLLFSNLTLTDLKPLVGIDEQGISSDSWMKNVDGIELGDNERRQVQDVQARLVNYRTQLVNEATVWARAIYPILVLAERDFVQAWTEVALKGTYKTFELSGLVDGVLGKGLSGEIEAPYLVVVEAKRGIGAQNPQYQLYGQLLAAARMNWELDQRDPQVAFGCYTVADVWTFVRAEVMEMESDRPALKLEPSREYSEKLEAETILKILKQIVTEKLEALSTAA
ncbi:hypothetical protein XM38_045480 [Halomicronema hongdechloris C2206]|uniref:Uncharacterized protein n=1 Tax=Halomicronema hongdechloris C2206 TaxID=1641165 RepID=A0A1Z3HTE9_9CYAN|nr:hypothetical protein [Halomicronema hongdechloris]ASC73579.1 hypothetical protein XM38_045480 [Halomicronema hongdechloris C2206]